MVINLPVCRWRRQPTAPGHHVCVSPRIRCNAAGIPDEFCLSCRHVDHDEGPPPRRRCRHQGDLVDVRPIKLMNRTDGASVLSRRHNCALHGLCTPNVVNAELPCCMTCPQHSADWERPTAGDVRHLTYFCYAAGPWWRWNIDQLTARMNLFNGARIVSVAVDQGGAEADEARALFASHDCELTIYRNDPAARELVAHQPMVERVSRYRGEADVTFYGHAKGVTSHLYGPGPIKWASEMYAGLLDYWPAVRRELVKHAAAGVFRRIMSPAPAAHVPWHYSGSFRWIRNKDLYSRNWQLIDPNFYGSETYPGKHFTRDESACLFGEFAYGGVGLYLQETWDTWAQAAVDEWKAAHQGDAQRPQLLTVILTAHSQRELVHHAIRSVLDQTADAWQLLIVHSGELADPSHFGPYLADGRVGLLATGETPAESAGRCGQGWAINEAWRRGRVRGDLIAHLSDDDVYAPGCVAGWLRWAADHPGEAAWCGKADRGRLHQGGFFELIGPQGWGRRGTPDSSLRSYADGLQICVRRSARTDWPERRELAPLADGFWMEAVAAAHPIEPADVYVGTHRHCPTSNFTR